MLLEYTLALQTSSFPYTLPSLYHALSHTPHTHTLHSRIQCFLPRTRVTFHHKHSSKPSIKKTEDTATPGNTLEIPLELRMCGEALMVTNTVACTYSQCCYSVIINEEIAWRLVHQTTRLSLHLMEGMYYKFKVFGDVVQMR